MLRVGHLLRNVSSFMHGLKLLDGIVVCHLSFGVVSSSLERINASESGSGEFMCAKQPREQF